MNMSTRALLTKALERSQLGTTLYMGAVRYSCRNLCNWQEPLTCP
jgi:hypothetical protein